MFGLMTISEAEQALQKSRIRFKEQIQYLHNELSRYILTLRQRDATIHSLELTLKNLDKKVRAQTEADIVLNAIRIIQNKQQHK